MRSLTQLDDYNQLLMAISEKDIPYIHQIIDIALRHGSSVQEVVNKLEDALEGAYTPRGYGADDLNIATLVFRLGGRQLLFALNQSLGLPSLHTLCSKLIFTSIVPTIGPIRDEQFDQNIWNIVMTTCAHLSLASLHGVSLMIDEIALEEMAVHFSKYNKVGGLCWKHSHVVEPVLRTYKSTVHIAQKIHNGKLHLGKELTVISISCFGKDEIYPILAAPTCKSEDASDMECILAHAIGSWNRTGASESVSPIWSLATDGDVTRRAAGHKLFVRFPLPPESPLYGTLHVFKCICTLIWAPGGIVLNNGRVINSMMLAWYLVWLPAYDEAAVMKLLHPDNPQDVPRAVELMLAIIKFSKSQCHVLNNSFSLIVDTHADLISISLLSALLESILTPFINQFQYLSHYVHLAYAFFHAHRRSFMSYQLYHDTQTMVKNACFSLAKQQSLDPHARFYLGNVGDNPLEILFGCTHMIGGHNSACSYAQAINRLGAAKDIDGVFKRHPELDPVDHINHEIWKGDNVVNRCDLLLVWRNGRDLALSILITSQLDLVHYSFADHFNNPNIDMLRLFGQNKYFGITTEEELEDPSHTILSTEDGNMLQLDEYNGHVEEDEIMLTFQDSDALSPSLPHGPRIRPDDYVLYDGRWIHKQTICRLVINKDFVSKSLNRLKHVREGYTKVNK
ncbi:uncharacterized protein EDB93DRAFT_1243134 [Suillus bovinus]|uniref:uncharacterized protein n=1 Tax=Suillus bovinus TaxID=48563 RepID=UPI001B87073C|nr:uncharacterized protein EDB93DRAFT_1243134 [Suillus bovinus]KAG2131407.1 hypothetical protein EDB93DRAFT_1243134 [Suillus bovinus]